MIIDQNQVKLIIKNDIVAKSNTISKDIENYIKQSLSTPYPPASSPGSPPHRRTGELINSVSSSVLVQDSEIIIEFISKNSIASYNADLEYGTESIAARPFMYPAMQEVKKMLSNFHNIK